MRRCAKGLAARHEAVAPRRRSRVRIRPLSAGPLRVPTVPVLLLLARLATCVPHEARLPRLYHVAADQARRGCLVLQDYPGRGSGLAAGDWSAGVFLLIGFWEVCCISDIGWMCMVEGTG